MNLRNKKELATRTLKVGKKRIVFINSRKDEIKEAIRKEDIRDLVANSAIIVKDIKGRTKTEKRKNRKGTGKIKKNVNKRKQEYVIMTRKLRAYGKEMLTRGKLTKDELKEIRKKIRNRYFKSKAHLKKHIGELNK